MPRFIPLAAVILLAFAPAAVRADLTPEEIAIVAARGNSDSEALAKYYAKARNVPAENIILVDVPKGEVCARKDWTWAIRPEIHKWLLDNDPGAKLRCLVTTWGIPLKIGPADVDAAVLRYKNYLQGERTARIKLLEDSLRELNDLAPGLADEDAHDEEVTPLAGKPAADEGKSLLGADAGKNDAGKDADAKADPADAVKSSASAPANPGPATPSVQLDRLRMQLETALRRAQQRIAKLPGGVDRNRTQQRLQQLVASAGGANVILQGINTQLSVAAAPDAANAAALAANFQTLRGVIAAWGEARALIEQQEPSVERDSLIIAVLERVGGQLAVLPWLDEQIATIERNETGASFDSELSLVMWPDDYQLLRWQPNYLRGGFDGSQLREVYRTLMVSRIDAPTLKLAKGLIDTAIAVEKEGLDGKVYFDARGLAKVDTPNVQPGSYPDYDRALMIVAKGIDEQTNMTVKLNDKPELFQKGECPDAALYCGWYSLGNYIDAFTFRPGAVAYHLASSECVTLHDPDTRQWCANLLKHGVCATVGPVYEPYLISFPRPEEFFAQLLQGKLTLVECYYRSQPFTSWMQVLIGDPLYRPFKNNPPLGATLRPVEPQGPPSSLGTPAAPPADQAPPVPQAGEGTGETTGASPALDAR